MQGAEAVSYDGSTITPVKRSAAGLGAMLMFDYPWAGVFNAFVDQGFRELHLVHINHGGVHGAWVLAVKS